MASDQQWISIPYFERSESQIHYYYIKSKMNGYVMETKGASECQSTCAAVVVSPQLNEGVADHQLWYLRDAGGGYINVVSKLNNFVLDISGCDGFKGAGIIIHPIENCVNQRWRIEPDGYIVSEWQGFVLDIKGAETSKEAPVVSWVKKYQNSESQLWSVEEAKVHPLTDDTHCKDTLILTYHKEHPSFDRIKRVVHKHLLT